MFKINKVQPVSPPTTNNHFWGKTLTYECLISKQQVAIQQTIMKSKNHNITNTHILMASLDIQISHAHRFKTESSVKTNLSG